MSGLFEAATEKDVVMSVHRFESDLVFYRCHSKGEDFLDREPLFGPKGCQRCSMSLIVKRIPAMTDLIPETGQELPIARIHPVDWTETISFLLELKAVLQVRSKVINAAFSIADNILVDSFIVYATNYIIMTHHSHYRRVALLPNGWTPSKFRSLYSEEVPEIFVSLARHLARPRLLLDHSVSLPAITMPLCDANLYNGLAAVLVTDVLRNGGTVGAVDAVCAAVVISGQGMPWRPRVYPALRRNFDGLKFVRLTKREGLTPARIYWHNDSTNVAYTLLDSKDPFEANVRRYDDLLRPIRVVTPQRQNYPAPPRPGDGGRAAWDAAYYAATNSRLPDDNKWMGEDVLSGHNTSIFTDQIIQWCSSMQQLHIDRTAAFTRNEELSKIGDDIESITWPALGVTEEIDEIRILVNDLGSGPKKLSKRDNKARNRSRAKQTQSKEPESKSGDGVATTEANDTARSHGDADILSDIKETKGPKSFKGNKKKPAPHGKNPTDRKT